MKPIASALLIALLLVLGGAGHAAERSYRLSGIVNTGDGRTVLVEFSDGERGWFREGDRIDDETVLEIAGDWIRVSLGETERRLWLTQGAAIPVIAGDIVFRRGGDTPAPANAAPRPSAHPAPSTVDVAQPALAPAAGPGEPEPALAPPPPEPIRDLATLATVLDLPPQARIVAVDMIPVETGEQVLSLIQKTLDLGGGAYISINGVPGVEGVYYHPDSGAPPPPAEE